MASELLARLTDEKTKSSESFVPDEKLTNSAHKWRMSMARRKPGKKHNAFSSWRVSSLLLIYDVAFLKLVILLLDSFKLVEGKVVKLLLTF